MKRLMMLTMAGWLAGLSLQAQDINLYTPGEGEGIVFFLPKTRLAVDVIATKVDYRPGELCQYANRYLRMNNVKAEPETYWEIKRIEVRSVGVPDSTKAYIVKLKDKEVMSNVDLSKNGVIRAINTTGSGEADERPAYELEHPQPHINPRTFMTEEILMAGSTAKMAELTAKDIYNIRESKNLILRGQADTMPKDGASLKLVIENLDKQEQAMTALFAGTVDRTDQVFTFYVDPKDGLQDQVAARFSVHFGVLPVSDLAGEPITLSMNSAATLPPPVAEDLKKKKRPEGVLYNIPGKAFVKVNCNGKRYFDGEVPVTQFGTTETLVSKLFDARVNTRVVFQPATGAIMKIDKD